MACTRRSLASKFTNLSHRFRPYFAHAVTRDDRDGGGDPHRRRTPPPLPSLPRSRSIPNLGHPLRCGRTLGILFPMGLDPFSRHFSSTPSRGANGGTNDVEFVENLSESLSDTAIEFPADAAAIPAATLTFFSSEVSLAAADSFPPVAALQYLIDGVHSLTALNWWACIALTTVLIRGATIPLLLNQMRATAKLNLMKPELEELKEQMQNNVDPESMQEGKRRMEALFKKHGVTPFTPLKGIFIQGPIFISFFLAISNMVEKVPSFKGGGAFWFTDLTAYDPTYAMPVLTAVTFLATVECNMQDGVEGNPMAKTMKNFSRGLAVMTVPFTAKFPMAIFCYWVTSNLMSLVYGFVVRQPPVRKFFNLPDIVPHPASNPATMPSFPFFGGLTKAVESVASPLAAKGVEQVKPVVQRASSSTVISQRIRNLEKTVKARSKKKKR